MRTNKAFEIETDSLTNSFVKINNLEKKLARAVELLKSAKQTSEWALMTMEFLAEIKENEK